MPYTNFCTEEGTFLFSSKNRLDFLTAKFCCRVLLDLQEDVRDLQQQAAAFY